MSWAKFVDELKIDLKQLLIELNEIDFNMKGMPLTSYLLKPMQRITKYPLLIKKVTPHLKRILVQNLTKTPKNLEMILGALSNQQR